MIENVIVMKNVFRNDAINSMTPVVEGVTFDTTDSLQNLYKLINTDIVEHLNVKVNDKEYDFWFDEEGKLKEGVKPTYPLFYNEKLYDIIFGNIVVTKSDEEGEITGIPDEEFDSLVKSLEKELLKLVKFPLKKIF